VSSEFFVLSLKWTRGDVLTWWAPDAMGYTTLIEQAGRFSLEQVTAKPYYYNNGESSIAIPCAEVEAAADRVVMDHRLGGLTGKRIVTTRRGLRVVGEVR